MAHFLLARRCAPQERSLLADALGDRPETVFACQRLLRGFCSAFLVGEPAHYISALVEALPGRMVAFGQDVNMIWDLLTVVPSWTSVAISPHQARALGEVIMRGTGQVVRAQEEL